MKISVIIPLYNCEKYITATLNSIKEQTYWDYEIIIVNDGSKDRSCERVEKWIENNPIESVVFVTQKNKGVSAARNHGLSLASGDYVIFCDADDFIHPRMLQTFIDAIDKYGTECATCTFTHNLKRFESLSISEPVKCDMKNEFLLHNSKFTFCGFIYKRQILQNNNILFSEDLKFGEDEEFTWKYLCHIEKTMFFDVPFYFYRTNNNSATRQEKGYDRTQVIDSVIRIKEYYRKQNNQFTKNIELYGVPRAKLAIMKEYAMVRNKLLFGRLLEDTKYKCSMSNVLHYPSLFEKTAVLLYIITPKLFYYSFSFWGIIKEYISIRRPRII